MGAIIISKTEYPVDLRPVCKLEFIRCGPVEKKQSALSVLFNHGSPTKFEIFLKIRKNCQKSQYHYLEKGALECCRAAMIKQDR